MALSQIYSAIPNDVITAARWNNEFGNIYNNGTDLAFPLTKAVSIAGFTIQIDSAGATTLSSTGSVGFALATGTKNGTPNVTSGKGVNVEAFTFTDTNTSGSGTATSMAFNAFQRPTLAATNALVTTTDAATVYIANSPANGANETITNPWSLWIGAGKSRFAGDVQFDANAVIKASTSFKGTLTHANSADRTYTLVDATGSIGTIASQAEVNAMTSTVTVLSSNHNKLVQGTLTSLSGTSIDFTGIPSGVKRITVMVNDVSTNGSTDLLFQIGTSGGIVTSGYVSNCCTLVSTPAMAVTNSTAGFHFVTAAASDSKLITLTLTLMDSATNLWSAYGVQTFNNASRAQFENGYKALAAVLDRVRITATNGTDTFDAGNINIVYER